jgi:hypothetical protein
MWQGVQIVNFRTYLVSTPKGGKGNPAIDLELNSSASLCSSASMNACISENNVTQQIWSSRKLKSLL